MFDRIRNLVLLLGLSAPGATASPAEKTSDVFSSAYSNSDPDRIP
jgi:hypothetical protein